MNQSMVMGVSLCHKKVGDKCCKFESTVLGHSEKKLHGKNHTDFITTMKTLNGAAA